TALTSLNTWPLVEGAGSAAPFYAQPLPLDSNSDGLTDQLLSLDVNGRIWRLDVTASRFGPPQLLADLSHPDWRFIASAGVVEVMLPLSLRPAGVPAKYNLMLVIARHIDTGEDA